MTKGFTVGLDYQLEYQELLKENQKLKIQMKKLIETIENLSSILADKEEVN